MEYYMAQKLSVVNRELDDTLLGDKANNKTEQRLRAEIEKDIRLQRNEKQRTQHKTKTNNVKSNIHKITNAENKIK